MSKEDLNQVGISKFQQSDSVEFELNKNQKYKLTIISNSDNIEIKAEDLVSFPKIEYFLQTNLNDLQKLNRFFLLFETPQEAGHSLINLVNKNNLILTNENDICKLNITNQINGQEFTIDLKKKEAELKPEEKEEIKGSIPLINDLKKRIDSLEETTKNLENKNKELDTINKDLEKKVGVLEEKIEKINKKLEGGIEITTTAVEEVDNSKKYFESNIIDKKDEKVIISWLQSKIASAELIFDTSVDGDSIEAFKKKCNGVCPTLLIIKTDRGIVFGGYASSAWKEHGSIQDYNSFVFSLNPKKKYNVTMPKYALYGFSNKDNILFQFGCCCFRVEGNCTQNCDSSIRGSGYEKGLIDLIQGDHKFKVSRLEVFKLNF